LEYLPTNVERVVLLDSHRTDRHCLSLNIGCVENAEVADSELPGAKWVGSQSLSLWSLGHGFVRKLAPNDLKDELLIGLAKIADIFGGAGSEGHVKHLIRLT